MQIDAEVSQIIEEAKARAKKVISEHRGALDAIAKELIEKRLLNAVNLKNPYRQRHHAKKKEEEGIIIALRATPAISHKVFHSQFTTC